MELLRYQQDIKCPFLISGLNKKIADIYKKYGRHLDEYFNFESQIGQEIIKNNEYIAFIDTSNFQNEKSYLKKPSLRISLSGWIFNKPFVKIGKNYYSIALSAHADFNELIQYIKNCGAKFVITDNFRLGSAHALSDYLNKSLKIKSLPLPLK